MLLASSELDLERARASKALTEAREARANERRALEEEIAGLERIIEDCGGRRAEMYETLVNHKREVLMEHKVQR